MQKILIIQTAFIGDAILATGIVEKLHAFFPEAQIDFLVRKGNESLLAGHPNLNNVLIWDKKEGKLKNLWKLLQYIRQQQYHKVINVQRFAATGLLTAFSGAGETIGFDKNPLSFLFSKRVKHIISTPEHPIHEIERNNALIEHITDVEAFRSKLYPLDKHYQTVSTFKTSPFICIAPASIWFTKQYPKEKWAAFVKQIPSSYTIHLIGGKEDIVLCDYIKNECREHSVNNLAGQLNLLESTALMQDAVMNYVNDSAPMHLASSINAPVTAVYCSTLPSFGYGPLSDIQFVVEIPKPLPCRPCGLHGHKACPLGHFKCAWEITEEQLLQSIP